MKLKDYFEETKGLSILSTADGQGRVTTAIYSAPRVREDNTIAFIMRERLTYQNLLANPHAAFMFVEKNAGYQGVRLFLEKMREDNDPEVIARMTRRNLTPEEDREKGPKHLVIFRVEKILPLIGAGESHVTIG
jgi:hypothetical protein